MAAREGGRVRSAARGDSGSSSSSSALAARNSASVRGSVKEKRRACAWAAAARDASDCTGVDGTVERGDCGGSECCRDTGRECMDMLLGGREVGRSDCTVRSCAAVGTVDGRTAGVCAKAGMGECASLLLDICRGVVAAGLPFMALCAVSAADER